MKPSVTSGQKEDFERRIASSARRAVEAILPDLEKEGIVDCENLQQLINGGEMFGDVQHTVAQNLRRILTRRTGDLVGGCQLIRQKHPMIIDPSRASITDSIQEEETSFTSKDWHIVDVNRGWLGKREMATMEVEVWENALDQTFSDMLRLIYRAHSIADSGDYGSLVLSPEELRHLLFHYRQEFHREDDRETAFMLHFPRLIFATVSLDKETGWNVVKVRTRCIYTHSAKDRIRLIVPKPSKQPASK